MGTVASRLLAVLCAVASLGFAGDAHASQTVTLAWAANSDPDLAGYRVYFGTSSGVYTQVRDVTQPYAAITGLSDGVIYYFMVTAYNLSGSESGVSNEISTSPPHYLLNISTRVNVQSGDGVMIGGFIISGGLSKSILIRALGPSLGGLGVENVLADPVLELFDSTGHSIALNDNWTELPSGTVPTGLEPENPSESVIAIRLPPGSYTAILRGANNSTGNALCELYDREPGYSSVLNMSTRGQVGSGDNVMIGGLIVAGSESSKVMIRALGPSLTADGVTGALLDPMLELHNADGSLIFQNDNWRSDQEQQIIDTTVPPPSDKESAIVATLAPGAYTAIVRGVGSTTGIALVEVYALNP